MKPSSLQAVVCEHCDSKLSTLNSLKSHLVNNKRCCKIQKEKQLSHDQTHPRKKRFQVQEESESEIIRIKPEAGALPPTTVIVDPVIQKHFLGLVQAIVTRHGGRDDVKNKDNAIGVAEDEVMNYQNSLYDPSSLQKIKIELQTWIQAFRYHVNCVWSGVQDGFFNPARGRGGETAIQQEISAAYMLAGWKKKESLNPRLKTFIKQKMALYAKYESLQQGYRVPQGHPLGNVYGETMTWRGPGEYPIQTIEDWSNVISYFGYLFGMAKKVIYARLKEPLPLSELVMGTKQHYAELLNWLSRSPDGYAGPRSSEFMALMTSST